MNTNKTKSFVRKIGNTIYTVKVCCDETASETFEDKLIRLIANGYLSIASKPDPCMRPEGAPA